MANGDTAASVGYPVVAGSADIRQGYDEVNLTRDLVAQHRLTGTHPMSKITGLAAALDGIRERPYIRREGIGGTSLLGGGQVGAVGTTSVGSHRGSWSGTGGLGNYQFSPPVSGQYTIRCTAQWTNPGGTGTVWLEFRSGMAAGDVDSGSAQIRIPVNATDGVVGVHVINEQMGLVSSGIYGFVFFNETGSTINRRMESNRLLWSVLYETPTGDVP